MMLNRRRFLSRSGVATLASAGSCLALFGDNRKESPDQIPDGSAAKGMITAETDKAIEKGLTYLAARRLRESPWGTNAYRGNTAVNSLAALAFMSAGHLPNRGAQGKLVTDTVRYILNQENRDGQHPGYLHNPLSNSHGPMYGHGFATLFLAEVSGMLTDREMSKELDVKLRRAVKLILDSQNFEGGWRYFPTSREADISVTICQIMALRAAKNAGVAIPKDKVDRCVQYVKNCQDRIRGSFRYMLQGGGGTPPFARTAAGVAALFSAGVYEGKEVDDGIRFLMDNRPSLGVFGRPDIMIRPDMHYFYGHYYAVQVMWIKGGKYWEEWYPYIRDELLRNQRSEGNWQDQICPHYATAMACLILQVPNNFLPIMQK